MLGPQCPGMTVNPANARQDPHRAGAVGRCTDGVPEPAGRRPWPVSCSTRRAPSIDNTSAQSLETTYARAAESRNGRRAATPPHLDRWLQLLAALRRRRATQESGPLATWPVQPGAVLPGASLVGWPERKTPAALRGGRGNFSSTIIGARGFEPRTSCSRSRRANRAALRPAHHIIPTEAMREPGHAP